MDVPCRQEPAHSYVEASAKILEIFKKSRMFSDVLQALYDQSGKSDPYFTSLNRNLTTMLAILILITYEKVHAGGQPRVTDIQEVINDFSCVGKYFLALAQIMGVDGGTTDIRLITADWLKGRVMRTAGFLTFIIVMKCRSCCIGIWSRSLRCSGSFG